jgi:outer membrane protein
LRGIVRIGSALGFACVLCACATSTPRWTPQTVAPPSTPASDVAASAPLNERATPVDVSEAVATQGKTPLTRDGALLTAILNNRSIEVARFGPEISQTFVPEARAQFDPNILATASYGRDTRLANRLLSSRSTTGIGTTNAGTNTTGTTSPGLQGGSSQSGSKSTLDTKDLVTDLTALLAQQTQPQNIADKPPTNILETKTVSGAVSITELLPTGTSLFLSGTAIGAESNLTNSDHLGGVTVGITQSLLEGAGFGPNLVALRQAKNRAAQSEYSLRATLLDVMRDVEATYWEMSLSEEVVGIREFGVQLAEEQLRYNDERFKVGKMIEGDVMAARAELATRRADLASAEAALKQQNIGLVRLLNPESGRPWDVSFDPVDSADVEQIPLDPGMSEQLALQYRPELADARLEIANSDLAVVAAKNDLLPRLDVSATYGVTSQGDGTGGFTQHLDTMDFDNARIGVEFQTPILNRAEKARYRRAKLITEQAESFLSDAEQATAAQVRQAVVGAEESWARYTASQEAVKARTEQLRVAQGRFEAGKETNLDLLIVQRDFLQSRIDEVTARIRYIQALTEVYTAEGTLLERRGVTFEMAAAVGGENE